MANFDVSNSDFSTELRKLETSDPGHANTFNPLFERLIKNDTKLDKDLKSIKIPITKVNNKTGDITLNAEDIKTNDGKSIETHLADMVKQQNKILDNTTKKKYKWIVDNGVLYLEEVAN